MCYGTGDREGQEPLPLFAEKFIVASYERPRVPVGFAALPGRRTVSSSVAWGRSCGSERRFGGQASYRIADQGLAEFNAAHPERSPRPRGVGAMVDCPELSLLRGARAGFERVLQQVPHAGVASGGLL